MNIARVWEILSSSKTKIGILGGAFDPITVGHIRVAECVLTANAVSEVWLMPCFTHRYGKQMALPELRLQMCKLAAAHNPLIKVTAFEMLHHRTNATYDVYKLLCSMFRQCHDFSLIIGMDNANTIDQWSNYKRLLDVAKFIVVPRKGEQQNSQISWYMQPPHIYLPDGLIPEISSTDIRDAIGREDRAFIEQNLDPKVLALIQRRKLYI